MKNSFLAIALFLFAISASSPASAACAWQSIIAGETKSGTLATDDCVDLNSNGKTYYYDKYNFTGTSGQQISILSTSSVIDPDLLLIYPDGSTTSYDNNGGGGTTARIPPTSGYLTLPAAGTYSIVASSALALQTGAYTLTLSTAGGSSGKTTTEFYNTTLRHYFVTAGAAEAAGIDNGAAGAGWVRTGHSFNVDETAAGTVPVCRFYGTPGVGPNSHFYTADAGECTSVKTDPGWFYEGIAFEIQPAQAGSCPVGTQPIYRAYNNRWMYNDSNHRFITNYATYLQMGERGWTLEGVVMCSTGIQSPTGITGGTFNDSSGAGVTVTSGEIPSSVNATQPGMTPSLSVPSGLTIDPSQGDVNVTSGAPAYDFNLTGDGGFTTTTAGAVTISLPFSDSAIPAADQGNTLRIFMRIFNPQDGSQVELTGDISGAGSNRILTVETRGLPLAFTAIVIYNPNMEAVTSEEATTLGTNAHAYSAAPLADKTALTTWPGQSWCVIYNGVNPNLIAAVKNVLGLAGNPSAAQIRTVVIDKVAGNARKSQGIYQTDGLNGPNLYIGRTACRDNIARYNIHMIDAGSKFAPGDPGEVANPETDSHYGRLYVNYARVDDGVNTVLGSVLASVSHEMQHAIQNGYPVCCGGTTRGYFEGTATIYGKTIDNGQVITVRDEIGWLDESLMTPGQFRYNNEDFFAYFGKQYNGGSLNYISGLYTQIRTTIGAAVFNPSAETLYGAMNTYFNTKFAQPLQTVYLDFVKQRALTHNASSQFGRTGEVVSGFAEGLFGATSVYKQNVNLASCSKVNMNWTGITPFSTRAIVVNPTGVLPAGSSGLNLVVKITPTASSVGALWNGFTWRATTASALAASNKFPTFGKLAGDQVVVLVSNLDPANTGAFNFEIGCEGPTITTLSPAKGPVDTSVTITGSGFGTSADTRSVSFNGLNASNVTWSSDTAAIAKVPANASTGDVIVEVNAVKSNGVSFEVLAQCSSTQNAGADTPDTRSIELGKSAGTFDFTYRTYSQKDQILVKYQGSTLFDTGCVGASGTKTLTYSGSATQITVQVIPNCAGGSGTAWDYSVACPR